MTTDDQNNLNGDIIPGHETARTRRHRERPTIALNLTSMIDVVFLLLVYFMVATQFKLGEEVYRLDIPDRRAAQQTRDPFELDEEPLRVRVATIGRLPGDYQVRLEGPYPQPGSFAELSAFARERAIVDGLPGGLFPPDHPIIIEPTSSTTWQHAMLAFNAIATNGYTNVTLGAVR